MSVKLEIQNILVYSELNDRYFYTTFDNKLNVIYGKNTAGKSTLIQLILYAFGINDNKIKLSEILTEEIFVRLDCVITKNNEKLKFTFIRQDETLIVKDPNSKVIRFNGIGSDQSAEHIKLKKYFNSLFDFNLLLESNSGISEAPMETLFLPYYVSQDVGWVYLRKSFSNLTFYKNFKEDFLDYYLGIENVIDREEKRKIENELRSLQQQMKFFSDVEQENQELEVSQIINDSLAGKANELIISLSNNKSDLITLEKDYVNESNKLTFYNQRLSVVSKVKRNHKNQFPGEDSCPTCSQILPENIEEIYEFFQEENDTISLQSELKEKIKNSQSKVNSINKKIEKSQKEINKEYSTFNKYSENKITLENWIENKANIQLYDNLIKQIGTLKLEIDKLKLKLKEYKTEKDIYFAREKKNHIFKSAYFKNNINLGIPNLEEDRFNKLYEISSFPFQGVQLHLAILSYHFAFNELLTKTKGIHRLPFILDSIFKEDIEGGNKEKILNFINSNFPKDTQTILSIADDKNIDSHIEQYKNEIFKDNAHMICIGDGTEEKALLAENDNSQSKLISETYEIMETI
ncbi:hypothetical protein CXF68_03690 [Tenacibaculum sp. Bg11-29]|uniref:hypothetical protein n=1 Tax=Tenacibaculum sp. Bg11-29 TaxID=2058306 RepID=UPI000C33AE27|nr:hypothetical protein [Tenacibaculum sp. Bg11-29]PKH49854.1 hypothetical protein CXF68_03690 [Tenacibaculum sp. Bg11-29]